ARQVPFHPGFHRRRCRRRDAGRRARRRDGCPARRRAAGAAAQRARPVLRDQRQALHRRTRAPRRADHLLHDGLHRGAQPDHPVRRRCRRQRAAVRVRRRGHGPHRRRHDAAHGHRRPVPLRPGDGPGHQRDRRGLRRHPAVLAGDHGPGRARGPAHHGARAHRVPSRGLRGHPAAAEDVDRRGHRVLPDDHRPGRRRVHPARPGGRRTHQLRHQRPAGRLAAAGLRHRAAAHRRAGGPQGPGRTPAGHRRHDRARDHHRGDRRRRPDLHRRRREPPGLGAAGAHAARGRRQHPGPVAHRQLLAVRRLRADRCHRRPAHRLLHHDRGLLRHRRHRDRRGRRGRPPGREAQPAQVAAGPPGRLPGRRGRWCGQRLVEHDVHREHRRCRRRRPHRAGQRRDRRALPGGDALQPTGPGGPVRGRGPGAGDRRGDADQPDQEPRLGRHVAGHPGLPDDLADAVHLLDHQRHRRRRRQLRAAAHRRGPRARHPPAHVAHRAAVPRLLPAGAPAAAVL
ncbi:MAG: Xanthine/uracil/thiamine/ascorbate permease family protein, partial [uncultured Blastococcus sp.]